MRVQDLPDPSRPRERLLREGATALSAVELIAVLLDTGSAGEPVLALAAGLLQEFGGLRGLCEAEPRQLLARRGVGPAKAARILAAFALVERCLEEGLKRQGVIAHPEDAARLLALRLRGQPREVFVGLFLDQRHRVIACEELALGTVHEAVVHPREVVRACIRHNAAALIVAHNHPSGIAEPSDADLALTRRLKECLAFVDVRLLDHLVIGDGEPVSLARRGLI